MLRPGGAASAAVRSPDGPWRGTYSCSAAIGSSGSQSSAFAFDLDLRLVNGSGAWKGTPQESNGTTLGVHVRVDSSTATVTRSFAGPNFTVGNQATLVGSYDGTRIQAADREQFRDCTFVLTRG